MRALNICFLNLCLLVVTSSVAFAAPLPQPGLEASRKTVREILSDKGEISMMSLRASGPSAYVLSQKLAFSEAEPMRVRWRAVMALAQLKPVKAEVDLKRALQNKTWFMRSAAVVASQRLTLKRSVKWARHLILKDKALMVRLSALDVLAKYKSKANAKFLWANIDSSKNFHRGRSLWIRIKMLKVLKSWAYDDDQKKFQHYSKDADPALRLLATQAIL